MSESCPARSPSAPLLVWCRRGLLVWRRRGLELLPMVVVAGQWGGKGSAQGGEWGGGRGLRAGSRYAMRLLAPIQPPLPCRQPPAPPPRRASGAAPPPLAAGWRCGLRAVLGPAAR